MVWGIRIEGGVEVNIRDDLGRAIDPMIGLVRELAERMRYRIHVQGLAGDGAPWSPYRVRQPKKGDGFYWSGVGQPQPDLHRIVIAKSGRHAGRAAYPSYAMYREAIGHGLVGGKTFRMTGELAASLEVQQPRPGVLSILYNKAIRQSPYFRAKSGRGFSNQKVAQFAFRTERMSPMQPTDAELAWFTAELAARIPPTLLRAIAIEAGAERSSRRASRLIGSANKLMQAGVP